ncbi:MAG: DUF424 domain-containing protein [Nanoarchaeota archaeon]
MFVNIIKSYRNVVAICDSDIIGKIFEEGDFQLNVKESFYKGEELNEEDVLKIIKDMSKEDASFNIIGEKSVNTAIRAGIISKENVKEIQKIPFSMTFM